MELVVVVVHPFLLYSHIQSRCLYVVDVVYVIDPVVYGSMLLLLLLLVYVQTRLLMGSSYSENGHEQRWLQEGCRDVRTCVGHRRSLTRIIYNIHFIICEHTRKDIHIDSVINMCVH